MKMYSKYAPYYILIIFLALFVPGRSPASLEWIGLVALFIGIIFLFEFIEQNRNRRIKRWLELNKRPNKFSYILRYCFLYGIPVSLIISILIYNKSTPLHLIIFILFPLLLIFGWISIIDWQQSYEESLSEKYKKV